MYSKPEMQCSTFIDIGIISITIQPGEKGVLILDSDLDFEVLVLWAHESVQTSASNTQKDI